MSVAAEVPSSPVAKNRAAASSPPPAPGRNRRRNGTGQVLADEIDVYLVSGNLLAQVVRSDIAILPDEFWYTGQLRSQIAILMGVEPCRLTLADATKGNPISDADCVLEGALTAIVGPEEQLVFEAGALPL